MRNKKAQVSAPSELLSYTIFVLIALITLSVLILGAMFLSQQKPKLEITKENYATNEQDFIDKKFLKNYDEEVTITLQILLNTPANYKNEKGELIKKILFKDALIEWANDIKAKPFLNDRGERVWASSGPGEIITTLPQEVLGKLIPTQTTLENSQPCYFFKVSSFNDGKEVKQYFYSSVNLKQGLGSSSYQDYSTLSNRFVPKSSYSSLQTGEGSVEVYLYYNKETC